MRFARLNAHWGNFIDGSEFAQAAGSFSGLAGLGNIAPAAGTLSDRIAGRPIMVFGLSLDAIAFAWIASIASPTTLRRTAARMRAGGIGTASFFASVANVLMSAVPPEEAGQASGATNAIREMGGVLGVAVLAAVFANRGGYQTPGTFVDGLAGNDDRGDHGRHRRRRGAADPAAAGHHRHLADAGDGSAS